MIVLIGRLDFSRLKRDDAEMEKSSYLSVWPIPPVL